MSTGGTERPEDDTEAAFRSIVEHYGERATLPDPKTDDGGTGDDGREESGADDAEDRARGGDGRGGPVVSPGLFRLAGQEVPPPAPEHADHFVPPVPPPVEWPEPRRAAAWTALFGSPSILLLGLVAGVALPAWFTTLLGLGFIGGFGYLVATMRRGPSDGWDDGARL